MNVKRKWLLSSTLAAGLVMGGCSAPQSPVDKLAQQDVVISTMVGAGIGAVVGAIIGNQSGNAAEGAAIGAALGAGTGLVVGNIAADRRKSFATQEEFLDAEIAAAERAVDKKSAEIAKLETDLETSTTEIDALVKARDGNLDVEAEARRKLAQVNAVIKNNNQTLKQYDDSVTYLETVITESDADQTPERLASLQAKQASLKEQYARLHQVNDGMVDQAERLAALLP